jgi:hypothetical protein
MALTCSFLPFCCSSVSTKSLTVWQTLELANLNLKSFEAMRIRETFQQIYQAPDMQTFKR